MSRPQAYYNEIDPACCAWLQTLMDQGLIMAGKIDNRSIYDVQPDDFRGFTRVGFFAGIGGWDLALQLAGWPEDRPIWHGSCPCQPFSVAGKGKGTADERHVWPDWFRLISQCRPGTIIGEQVASPDALCWLDGVSADLEGADYACGAVVLGAHSAGADHQRQRIYWVAESKGQQLNRSRDAGEGRGESENGGSVGDADINGRYQGSDAAAPAGYGDSADSTGGGPCGLANSGRECDERRGESGELAGAGGEAQGEARERQWSGDADSDSGTTNPWDDSYPVLCRDGKWRRIPIEPNFFIESDGIPDMLGAGWDSLLGILNQAVKTYAAKTKTGPAEALREMRRAAFAEALRSDTGGYERVQEAEVLLFGLCQLTGHSQFKFLVTAQDQREIQHQGMRHLWKNFRNYRDARSPQGQGLDQSRSGESGNIMLSVPHEETPQREAPMPSIGMPNSIAMEGDVRKTLAEVQEIWRSSLNEGKGQGDSKWIQCARARINAFSGFPLTEAAAYKLGGRRSIRAPLLRGAGNAIVPQTAAMFIQAYMTHDQH